MGFEIGNSKVDERSIFVPVMPYPVNVTITATEEYSWVIFRFTLQKPSGTAWFDNAELIKLP